MRVLFVYPAYENLGIRYLSAVARQAGHHTQLVFDPCLFDDQFTDVPAISWFFDRGERVVQEVVDAKPEVICFSLVSDKYWWFLERAAEIRKRLPGVPIVAGGIHITSVPEVVLEKECCDFVVTGEGEEAFVELLDCLEHDRDYRNILNLGFRRDGVSQINPKRPLIDPLDQLPFTDKELYQHTSISNRDVYTIMASRGCPLKCTFCNNNIYHREYQGQSWSRTRSVDSVIAELRQAVLRWSPREINFLDEIFALKDSWLEEFAERYKREIRLPYIACLYPGFLSESRIQTLAESGCVKVDIGVQSVNEELRREIMLRKDTNEHIANGIRALKHHGITVAAENIVSVPGEKEEHLIDMARFYNELRPDILKFFWLKYYPKTEMIDVAHRLGQLDDATRDRFHRGEDKNSIATGGSIPTSRAQKFYTLFVLLPYLKPKSVELILRHRLYRWLPPMWFPRFSYLILRFLNQKDKKSEVVMHRYVQHYKRYVSERLWDLAPRPLRRLAPATV